MSRGYLLFALESNNTNYCRLAYACALSIKLTQPEGYNNVSVITNDRGYFGFKKDIFDQVIPGGLLKGMDARASAYDLSPYDETVLLDSDMMLLQPLDYCWEMVNDLDLYIASSPQDYRQRKFKYGAYRTEFKQNNWPDVYSAWTYFKKSPYAEKFFTTVKFIIKNQQEFLTNVLPDSMLTNIPTDEAFAIALAILGIEDTVVRPDWQSPRITHMKPAVQKFDNDVAEWNDNLRFMMNTLGQIKLGVWQQADILHYVKKELITENDLIMLEAVL